MDQATHNKIVSFIWGIADDVLRDLFKRGKYPDVILPMCVIRRMDAVLEPTKRAVLDTKKMLDEARITEQRAALCDAAGQAFYNTSKFTLRDLKSRGSQQQLLADFEDYLNGFSPNVQDIKAVQTLSRLNRAHPQKHDCFVLDFQNNSEAITFAFQDYYRTTLLAEETDPNKLHDLKAALDAAQVYSPEQVQQVVKLFLGGADRDKLDPILDACVAVYVDKLDEDGQVDFKGKAKVFCRTYSFLSSVIRFSNEEWEKLSILLDLLTPKLPAPQEEDLSKGILEAIDMDSYRVEKKAIMKIALADKDAEIEPVPTDVHGHKPEPELDRLSNILKTFNEQFGTLFTDTDRVIKRIRDDIAPKVAADAAYQNAKENTPHTARMAHDQALAKVMQHLLKDDTQVYKQFVENESFKRFVGDMVYALTSEGGATT